MRTGFRILSLVPGGLVFDSVSDSTDSIILTVRSETAAGNCPLCGVPSSRVHSRYLRCVADLPCAGREVRFRMITRRFVCEVPHCRRRIFAERFRDDVVPIRARRTVRLERIVHHLGLALGGRPAAGFAKVSRRSDAAHQRQVALIFASGHNCMVLKLGIDVGQTTVVKYMPRGERPRVASMDLFVFPTISFQPLYGLLILHHDRRQILWLGVTVIRHANLEAD